MGLDYDDVEMQDLEDPEFLRYVEQVTGGEPIHPDDDDFDWSVTPVSDRDAARMYQRAQARKLKRLFIEWRRAECEGRPQGGS